MPSTEAAPSYHDVADALRLKITSGELSPGAAVSSQAELAREYGVGGGTARMALTQLVSEGLITAGRGRTRNVRNRTPLIVYASRYESAEHRPGSGVDSWIVEAREQGREPTQAITVEIVQAGSVIGRWLGVGEESLVAVRRRMRTLDGQPDNINDSYYPMDLAQGIPELISPADVQRGVNTLLAERGHVQVRYVDELRWRPPTPDEAERLQVPAGVSVLVQTRTGYTTERAVRTAVTTWPGDSHAVLYELPA